MDFREKHYEIINGEKILFNSETCRENRIHTALIGAFAPIILEDRFGFMFTSLYTYLPDGNKVIPDLIFIDKSKANLLHEDKPFRGVPDMVVEIFSRSTMKRDITVKKEVYERNGVREYWMIDPWRESIEVYLLRDGKFFLDEIYFNYSDAELAKMSDEERAAVKLEIPVAVLDGFKIQIKNLFGWF